MGPNVAQRGGAGTTKERDLPAGGPNRAALGIRGAYRHLPSVHRPRGGKRAPCGATRSAPCSPRPTDLVLPHGAILGRRACSAPRPTTGNCSPGARAGPGGRHHGRAWLGCRTRAGARAASGPPPAAVHLQGSNRHRISLLMRGDRFGGQSRRSRTRCCRRSFGEVFPAVVSRAGRTPGDTRMNPRAGTGRSRYLVHLGAGWGTIRGMAPHPPDSVDESGHPNHDSVVGTAIMTSSTLRRGWLRRGAGGAAGLTPAGPSPRQPTGHSFATHRVSVSSPASCGETAGDRFRDFLGDGLHGGHQAKTGASTVDRKRVPNGAARAPTGSDMGGNSCVRPPAAHFLEMDTTLGRAGHPGPRS